MLDEIDGSMILIATTHIWPINLCPH